MLRTRQKGKAEELLCSACDLPYAEILPDRLMVYSLHYGKGHTSAFGAPEIRNIYNIASSGGTLELECSCGLLPCAGIQSDRLVIQSKHKVPALGWRTHTDALLLEDIAEIYARINQTDDIISDDSNAPVLAEIRQAS